MEKQISIIIPTYNMERYIGKCLDSLLIPEFDQVEVLVVNDGSKDRSSEIAHGYADRYPGSIRVIDKENGNYGSCINAALPQCTGRYVKILDADDTFDTAAFSEFVRQLPVCNEDVLITPFITVNESYEEINRHSFDKYFVDFSDRVMSFSDAMSCYLLEKLQMHSITYNIDVFKRFQYKQTEGISFTDTEWATQPLSFSNSMRLSMSDPLYVYLLGREGQTVDPKRFVNSLNSYFTVFVNRLKFLESEKLDRQKREFLNAILITNHSYIYSRIIGNSVVASRVAEYDKLLKEKHPEFYKMLGDRGLYPHSKFKFIKKWRETNYLDSIHLPLYHRILISLNVRLKQLSN